MLCTKKSKHTPECNGTYVNLMNCGGIPKYYGVCSSWCQGGNILIVGIKTT